MKIQCIGTGSVTAPQLSASTLLDRNLLVDMGSGIVKKLLQVDKQLADVQNCLVTHLHGDHFEDLLLFMIVRDRQAIEKPANVYGPIGLENKLQKLLEVLDFPEEYALLKEKAKVNIIEFKKLEKENIGNETYVTSYEVEHGKCVPAYGFVVKRGNHTIGFSGDSCYCKGVSQIIEQSEIAVLDMCLIQSTKGHMGVGDIVKIATENPNKKFITTHMSEKARQKAKEKELQNLIIPDDGTIINWE